MNNKIYIRLTSNGEGGQMVDFAFGNKEKAIDWIMAVIKLSREEAEKQLYIYFDEVELE